MKTHIQTNLPGIRDIILNFKPITPDENQEQPMCYKVTGHTIPTVTMTADEVMSRFEHDFDNDGRDYLTIVAKDDAHIELSSDVRHGIKGFRANRYEIVNPANQKRMWDEWPMFFEALDQVIELFAHPVESNAYIDGKKAARLRF
jgi:hypothetical protein